MYAIDITICIGGLKKYKANYGIVELLKSLDCIYRLEGWLRQKNNEARSICRYCAVSFSETLMFGIETVAAALFQPRNQKTEVAKPRNFGLLVWLISGILHP